MPFRFVIALDPREVILKCTFTSLPSTRPFGSSLASSSVRTLKLSEKDARALSGWELIGFGFHRNSEVKRVRARAIP
ncbi:hypothetical protein DVH24_022929 [Malus domestica]|uniref:Uncharacterized protein n=1 Tax=Malus domestica TaxID=3750 RepID=A0A498KSV2_MALDO|nr:hypothetical protein DVH24_022929 [Malus domestica]